jgi:pimeloyl-ACP methyl ester carboxylesterase
VGNADGFLVDTGAVRLWCHDAGGAGEPVVLLGGMTAGHFIWDFVRPYLIGAGFRTITWEPRGLGASERPAPPYGVEVWADDLRDVLGVLGVERTHVWATGFGSYYALRFAAVHADVVGALVTYTDSWPGDPGKGYSCTWETFRTIVETRGARGEGARQLARVFHVPWLPWFEEWEAANVEEVVHADTLEHTLGYALTAADVRDELERIRAPVLALLGGLDRSGRPADLERDASLALLAERVEHLEVAVIEGSHPAYAIAHKPRECAEAVTEFLRRHPLGAPTKGDAWQL